MLTVAEPVPAKPDRFLEERPRRPGGLVVKLGRVDADLCKIVASILTCRVDRPLRRQTPIWLVKWAVVDLVRELSNKRAERACALSRGRKLIRAGANRSKRFQMPVYETTPKQVERIWQRHDRDEPPESLIAVLLSLVRHVADDCTSSGLTERRPFPGGQSKSRQATRLTPARTPRDAPGSEHRRPGVILTIEIAAVAVGIDVPVP